MLIEKWLTTFGKYLILMGRSFSRPERMRMFLKQYIKEMSQLGIDSIGIVLLISFFIGAVICIQMKLNIQSPWMPRWVSGYTTREIMLLEFCHRREHLRFSLMLSHIGSMVQIRQTIIRKSYHTLVSAPFFGLSFLGVNT